MVMLLPLMLWILLSLIVAMLFVVLASLFFKESGNVDTVECFECGIDTISGSRVPFALHFFMVAVIFVLFDAEIILSLVFIIPPVGASYWWYWWGYLGLLFLGLIVEFFMQTIDWKE